MDQRGQSNLIDSRSSYSDPFDPVDPLRPFDPLPTDFVHGVGIAAIESGEFLQSQR